MTRNFDIDIETTASVNPDTVTNIIVAVVEKQTGRQVSDIRIKYDGDKFDGYSITFDPKIKSQSQNKFKPSKEFIVTNFDEY
jgi:hypothetical protein